MSGTAFVHIHVTLWTILLILFIASFVMLRGNKEKGQKITHMILRLFYILVLLSGLHLVAALYHFSSLAVIKGLIGLLVIVSMELVLVRGKKGKNITPSLLLLIVSLVLVFYFGYVVLG
jgi:preprotein translocase subunit YajC